MIASVTALGSATGDAAGAAADVVNYLEGRCRDRGGHDPGHSPDLPSHDDNTDVVGYYADAMAAPGIWMGTGLTGVRVEGMIDSRHLEAVLLGRNPFTGDQLLMSNGSAQRAHADDVRAALRGPDDKLLSLTEAADALGVSASYLRQQATATAKARALQAREAAAGEEELTPLPSSYVDAVQARPGAHWQVRLGELRRFAAERSAPAVTIGYDVTFSAPKSVSVLWATATPAQQVAIEAALTDAVRAGIAYLEANAAHVRVSVPGEDGGTRRLERQAASGLIAAAYLHDTSRALDPQLHFHVVVANMAEGPDGKVRALDGRSLFLHAKTAGYLAAAELRQRLARDLGVTWQQVNRGLSDIEGVPRAAILEMSQRSREINEHIADMDKNQPTSARGRQVAAYDTRAPKESSVDPDSLRPAWAERLAGAGFDRRAIDACYGRQRGPALVTESEQEELFTLMLGAKGITEHSSTFDRRDVLQFVAQWGGDRLSVAQIEDLADSWLAGPEIMRLDVDRHDARTGDAIRRQDGQAVPAIALDDLYTTRTMLRVEQTITAGYVAGRSAGAAQLQPALVAETLARWPHFSQDQAEMVRAITTSGHRIQLIRGDAGAGKTTALEAAARAWEAAGYNVIGCAVQGTAAEIVADKVKVPHSTLESLLYRIELGDRSIGPDTVILADECSTLGNRDFARLVRAADATGATVRLAGDPRQHTAVAAGGAWRALLEAYPDDVPAVTKVWRQRGEDMADVREALEKIRNDDAEAGIAILRQHGRITEYASRDELLDAKAAEWYDDHLRHLTDPDFAKSSVMTPYHRDRRDLNARIRELLKADGTLTGPILRAGDLEFQRGDHVMALEQDRGLQPPDARRFRRDFVHTAEEGVVLNVRLPERDQPGSVLVDFERRGQVEVPMEYLTRRLDRGIHGALAHSYAMTTNAAEGGTFGAARGAGTENLDAKAAYVMLTRSTHELSVGLVNSEKARAETYEHPEMPRLDKETDTLAAFSRNMASDREELLATEIDRSAAAVAAVRSGRSLADLDRLATSSSSDAPLAAVARRQTEQAIASQARQSPPPELVERLGLRPPPGPARAPWDEAVGRVAVYRARYSPSPVPDGAYVAWALGPVPAHPAHEAEYQEAGRAVLIAEQTALAARPTADLARERAQLRSALQPPTPATRNAAAEAVTQARARYDLASSSEHKASADLQAALHRPRRRPNPTHVRAAEERLQAATAERADAAGTLALARQRVAALEPEAVTAAQLPLRQRLDSVDGAIARKVRDAVASPAPYVSTALGPRPSDATQRERWNEAARCLETWRHGELGLGPQDGALGEDGLSAALGPVPTDPAQAMRRELVVKQLPIEFQPHRTAERTMDGPALTID